MEGKPKFKIGQRIYATWMGGSVTRHVITKIELTSHGYWYTWNDKSGNSGLHEKYLSAKNPRKW